MTETQGMPFDTLCTCGHTAVMHFHGKRHKRVILSHIGDCSECKCTLFREPVSVLSEYVAPSEEQK